MVGTSFWMNDVNVDAPIMSPAAANTVFGLPARIALTALDRAAMPPDGADCSMRPWKSLTVTRSMSTVEGRPDWPTPTTIGSWSLDRNGVPASVAVFQYSRPTHSGELIGHTAALVTRRWQPRARRSRGRATELAVEGVGVLTARLA